MNLKDITIQLLNSFLTHPTAENMTISRELCVNLFDIMKLLTWFFGPEMTYDKLKKIYEAK